MTLNRDRIEQVLRDRFLAGGGSEQDWAIHGDDFVVGAMQDALLGKLDPDLAAAFERDDDPTDKGLPARGAGRVTPEQEAAYRWTHGGRRL